MKRILRPIFARIARSLGISEIQVILENLSNDIVAVREGCDAMNSVGERRTAETRDALMNQLMKTSDAVTGLQTEMSQQLSEHRDRTTNELSAQRRRIDMVRASLENNSHSPTTEGNRVTSSSSDESRIDDSLYMALEDHFRGSEASIKERQSVYLPYVQEIVTDDAPLLDIGCGRGEWLTLLKENGIAASGIDTNTTCVHDCKSKNLDVSLRDLVDELTQTPEGSLGAVTMFQVMEHLPFLVLIDAFRLIRRALKPGGILIAEVPNAKNLRVSAGTFWIDPTHQKPLYPELLQFLATETGFSSADGLYLNNLSPGYDLSSLSDGARQAVESLVNAIDTFGDFALVARA